MSDEPERNGSFSSLTVHPLSFSGRGLGRGQEGEIEVRPCGDLDVLRLRHLTTVLSPARFGTRIA